MARGSRRVSCWFGAPDSLQLLAPLGRHGIILEDDMTATVDIETIISTGTFLEFRAIMVTRLRDAKVELANLETDMVDCRLAIPTRETESDEDLIMELRARVSMILECIDGLDGMVVDSEDYPG